MKNIITLLFLFILSTSFAHKYYVSIADMEYDEATNQINVSLKATAHDFENMVEKYLNKKMDIELVTDSSKIGRYIQSYLKNTFKLFSEDKQLTFAYLGKEVDLRDNLYFYFSFTNVINPANITIENIFLMQLYSDQQNIVHYKYKNASKSITLAASATKQSFKF